jgi:MinD superfamily P-loop ATPase
MNEIVVLSGKGGTGKTSFTASLAVLAGSEAVIADCDVDAANMHLLLKPDFGKTFEFFSGEKAYINQDLCTNCGKCTRICRFHAIAVENERYQVKPLDCEGCGYCEKICPEGSISMEQWRSGSVYISKTKTGSSMVHAKLDVGAENSGKLVARVKNEAKSLAVLENKPYIIVDGSPGIGCPVVSSLAGANYVILVTEPTLSGLHDLKRVLSVIGKFRIKAGCVINKYDLNQETTADIQTFLTGMGIDHLADIPYDVEFTRAMVTGKTIVEMESPLKKTIEETWSRVQKIISLDTKKIPT